MTLNPSVVSIGKAAGVSHATVSDVLNGRWQQKRISVATRDRVLRVARELHYRPNRLVHSVFTGRTHTVALIVPDISISYFPRIAAAIEAEAKRHGYHVLISQVVSARDEAGEIEVLLERRVDGLILVPKYLSPNRANYRRLIGQGIPLVFVDAYLPDVPCPAVVGSDEEGMRLATRHLIALGHQRIAYLGKGDLSAHMHDRLRGFRWAMADAGLAVPDERIICATSKAITALLRRSDRPTALVATTDYEALDAMQIAESMGLRVPDDLAVVGFSDYLDKPEFYRIPLTSVRMDLDEMGRLAMQRFLCEIGKVSKRHSVTHVAATLVVRASCGAKRGVSPFAARSMRALP